MSREPPTPSAAADRAGALEAVMAAYESALLRYATRVLRDADMAQDVVQDAFISLHRHWRGDKLEPGAHVATWLYQVVYRRAVDLLRHRERRDTHLRRHREETVETMDDHPARRAAVSERAERAAAALATLEGRERQLVVLKVYEGKSYKEIAAITGLTATNVGYILHQAMKRLAAALRAEEGHA